MNTGMLDELRCCQLGAGCMPSPTALSSGRCLPSKCGSGGRCEDPRDANLRDIVAKLWVNVFGSVGREPRKKLHFLAHTICIGTSATLQVRQVALSAGRRDLAGMFLVKNLNQVSILTEQSDICKCVKASALAYPSTLGTGFCGSQVGIQYPFCPGIQFVPASGTCAMAAASTVKDTKSSGSRLCTWDFPQARAMVCASSVITFK